MFFRTAEARNVLAGYDADALESEYSNAFHSRTSAELSSFGNAPECSYSSSADREKHKCGTRAWAEQKHAKPSKYFKDENERYSVHMLLVV